MNKMRKYIAKDEENLMKQIESDPGLDKELEWVKLIKKQVRQEKNPTSHMCDTLQIRAKISYFTDRTGTRIMLSMFFPAFLPYEVHLQGSFFQ